MARRGEKKGWDLAKTADRWERFVALEIRACPKKYHVHLARAFRSLAHGWILVAKQLERGEG